MHLNLVLLPVFFVLMIGDVVGRIKKNDKIVSICQPGTTLVVLVIAMMSLLVEQHNTAYTLWISLALLISAVADAMLVDRNDPKGFIKGMILFMGAIMIYGITWTVLSGFQKGNIESTFVMMAVFVFIAFIFYKFKYTDKRKPTTVEFVGVLIYLFVFCLVISRAISTFNGSYFSSPQSWLMVIGSILFFLGDCQLGIYHFLDVHFPMKQAPPFYFIGQLLIGLSCSYF